MRYTIEHQSVLDWAKSYTGPKFHALICDPPYHLTSITDRFGKPDSAPAQFGKDGAFGRVSKGFMGSVWDGGDIAFQPSTWAAIAEHLHPGAFGMAFASTRGFHRMAVAIEDAGLIIHPTIFCWGFSTGFPKATRLDTTIDRRAGAQPTVIGKKRQTGAKFKQTQALIDNGGFNSGDRTDFDLTEATTDMARAWAGHRYGLQALKPALEPIIIFQKPYDGDPVSSITTTGAGAWNIDAGRIGRADNDRFEYGVDGDEKQTTGDYGIYGKFAAVKAYEPHTNGRWPSNLILSHSPLCTDTCVDDCPVKRLGDQSGESSSKASQRGAVKVFSDSYKTTEGWQGESTVRGIDNSGTAARFFFNADYALDRLEDSDPLLYVAKSSSAERDAGLHELGPITVDDGRDTPIDNAYLRGETARYNPHPTIKPIALIKHLASLLLPPDSYESRLLIPFSGAGSEMIGALLAGWQHVTGIELEAKHVDVARLRLDWWLEASRLSHTTEPKVILEKIDPAKSGAELNEQLTLMDLLS
jgi:hypothetical protein